MCLCVCMCEWLRGGKGRGWGGAVLMSCVHKNRHLNAYCLQQFFNNFVHLTSIEVLSMLGMGPWLNSGYWRLPVTL